MNEGGDKLAYTTVLSLLQVMEQKGLVRHRQIGKAYLYAAEVRRDSTFQKLAGGFLERFLTGDGRISGPCPAIAEYELEELDRLEEMIAAARNQSKRSSRKEGLHERNDHGLASHLVHWLLDYYLAATLLLVVACLGWRWVRQPAHRITAAWTVMLELIALAVVCALPFWREFL